MSKFYDGLVDEFQSWWWAGFAVVLALYYAWLMTKKSTRKLPFPPGPPVLPLLGNLPFLQPDLNHYLTKLSNTYGPIMRLQLGRKICIVISSASLAKIILKDNDAIFANHDVLATSKILFYGGIDIVFSPNGPQWRKMRKIFVHQLMSNASLDACYALPQQGVREMVKDVHSKAGSPIDISEQMFIMVLNVTMSMVWGAPLLGEERNSIGPDPLSPIPAITTIRIVTVTTIIIIDHHLQFRSPSPAAVDEFQSWWWAGFVVVLALYYAWLMTKKSTRKLPLPPGPPGLPLLGNLPFLQPDLNQYLTKLSNTYGPIMRLQLGRKICIVISSASPAKIILKDNDAIFANHDGVRDMVRDVHSKAGSPIDISEQMLIMVLNVTMSMVRGASLLGEERNSIGPEFRRLVKEVVELASTPNISDFFPVLAPFDLQGIKSKTKKILLWFDQMFESVIAGRMKVNAGYTIPQGSKILINLWKIQRDPEVWENPSEFEPEGS
ncbi:hypothetical protein SLEP1_g42205 [Rubroshorea leprosula]|uniref:Cytochrome P450 n=1 Tax=Rubroshorea leprosula TaxID=152421 RepID=A0AAV5L922_9ROSI|nr:hypothetical protein SLEP1_g42205 [Rubroshorea leprosula]